MTAKMYTQWIAAACLVAMTTACVPSQDYPNRQTFGINPGTPEVTGAWKGEDGKFHAWPTHDLVLRVLPVRVASPFATQKFTYRVGEDTYETDYYNGFADAPDRLLTASLTQWLRNSLVFQTVIDQDSTASANFELETNIVELYGAYRMPNQPSCAMLSVRFILLERQGSATRVLSEFGSAQTVSLKNDKPAALARGLGESWGKALTYLTDQLRQETLLPAAE